VAVAVVRAAHRATIRGQVTMAVVVAAPQAQVQQHSMVVARFASSGVMAAHSQTTPHNKENMFRVLPTKRFRKVVDSDQPEYG
jgi:hypothetical protein